MRQKMKPMIRALSLLLPLAIAACRKSEPTSDIPTEELTRIVNWDGDGKDLQGEMARFYGDVRLRYNNRQFAELEIISKEIHSLSPTFTDGFPKIIGFYDSFKCRDDEPENMWQLHDQIHKDWIAEFPDSITAKVAHARFLTEYAWHARGSDWADKVPQSNMQTFTERLKAADAILDGCAKQRKDCPVWSLVKMRAALGLGTEPAEFDKIFRQAKADFPKFHKYDTSRAYYLLPRWHGKEGEWEKAAHNEIFLEDGGGHAAYARVIIEQRKYYDEIFAESAASWPDAKKGFEQLLKDYPSSLVLLNLYCRLACEAGDAVTANDLFKKIGKNPVPAAWKAGKYDIFEEAKEWASTSEG
jgi:Domain of unknown function (DUF4034)